MSLAYIINIVMILSIILCCKQKDDGYCVAMILGLIEMIIALNTAIIFI